MSVSFQLQLVKKLLKFKLYCAVAKNGTGLLIGDKLLTLIAYTLNKLKRLPT